MNVLVTGAAGFIASNLVHYLVEQRPTWKLTALDSLTYAGNLENIAGLLDGPQVHFIKADIADGEAIAALFEDQTFDLIFHLAAESHVDRSIHSAAEFVRTNVLGTQTLLTGLLKQGKGRFVHISTDEVYGSLGATGEFYETTPLDPTSPYASSKAASDLMVLAAQKTHAIDAVITRCTNNYGSYQFPEKFIPLFVTNALEDKPLPLYGDGMNVRSWIHVRDHCSALLLVAEQGRCGEVYNIGGLPEDELPNREVAQRILGILDKPETLIEYVRDRPAHDLRYAVAITKIKDELGWEPTIPFESGLPDTVQWYLDNKAWWEGIKSGAYREYYAKQYGERG